MNDINSRSDSELAAAIRDSDTSAMKDIYYRYYESLYHFIWLRTNSIEITEDFTHDVFSRLWYNRQKLTIRKSLKAYLYRIANNLVIDYYRKNSHRKAYLSTYKWEIRSSSTDDIDKQLDIEFAINKLPEKLRTIFILSRFKCLTYVEISKVCNISIKTVENRMCKALSLLRSFLV